jgi:predicted nucleic acid-binding protein
LRGKVEVGNANRGGPDGFNSGGSGGIGGCRQTRTSIRHPEDAQFDRLRSHLRPFPDAQLEAEDYEEAAHMSNRCRSRGIAGSSIDFLICATAHRRSWAIFTIDRDFQRFAEVLPVRLFSLT